MGVQELIAMGSAAVAGLIWLIRLEGRINVTEAMHKSLRDDVQYIRSRIDAALNGHDR